MSNPPFITKEGALAYFKQFLNGDTGTASAEVLTDIMLTVQQQARAPLIELLEECRRVIHYWDDKELPSLWKRLNAELSDMP